MNNLSRKGNVPCVNSILALTAVSVAIPASLAVPTSGAEARKHYRGYSHQRRCTHSGGTTGLVVGGVGGALIGNSVLGHGALGTLGGAAAAGAFGGRAIDRTITAKRRCR